MRRESYCYRPYCAWRHNFARERALRAAIIIAKFLLIAEAVWFGFTYVRAHTSERIVDRIPVGTAGESTDRFPGGAVSESADRADGGPVPDVQPAQGYPDVYGIGIERDGGGLFWFHSRTERETGP